MNKVRKSRFDLTDIVKKTPLLPVTFDSQKPQKGVYYLYFTIGNPDSEGCLTFSIIILLRYNIIKKKYYTGKREDYYTTYAHNGLSKGPKGSVLVETSNHHKK